MPVRASFQPSGPGCLVLGRRVPSAGAGPESQWRARQDSERSSLHLAAEDLAGYPAVKHPKLPRLTSDQVGIPAELKHINKRRKRNQQGLPQ